MTNVVEPAPITRRPAVVGLVFAAALAVRLIAIGAIGPSRLEIGDAGDYLRTSAKICDQGDYPDAGNLPFFRAPGLPIFLCLVTACHPERLWLAKVGLAAVDSLTVLVIWAMAATIAADSRWRMLPPAFALLDPFFVYQAADVRSEPLFMFLLSGALYCLFAARSGRSGVLLPMAGALSGLAALTRPAALAVIPLLAVAWIFARGARPSSGSVAGASLIVLSAALVIAPWTAFMVAKHDEVILVNDAGGYNLWRGTHPELTRAMGSTDQASYRALTTRFELVTSPEAARTVAEAASSPMGRDRVWREMAIERMSRDPGAFLRAVAWNVWRFWRPWLDPREHRPAHVTASALVVLFLYLVGAAGIAGVRREDPWLFWFVILWLGVATALHAPFQTVMRFRIPFTDALLIAFLGQGMQRLTFRG